MTVEFFNIHYFLYLAAAIGLTVGLYFALRGRTDKTKFIVILSLCLFNFGLHFLKLAFEPYRSGLPATIRKTTFENICAVSTLIFPWLFLSKKNTARDYMYYIGALSGLAALIIPTEALGKLSYSFDTIRFYICHTLLLITGLLPVLLHLHKPDYRKIYRVPLCFLAVMCAILINEVILMSLGWVEGGLAELLSPSYRNNSFIFGPTPDFAPYIKFFTALVPKFLTYDYGGQLRYVPILWIVIPLFVYMLPLCFLMALPYEWRRVRDDFIKIKTHFKERKNKL